MGSGFFLSFTFLCDIFLLQENSYRGKMIASNPRLIFFTQVGIQKGEQPSPSQHLYNRFHGGIPTLLGSYVHPFHQAL